MRGRAWHINPTGPGRSRATERRAVSHDHSIPQSARAARAVPQPRSGCKWRRNPAFTTVRSGALQGPELL